MSVSPKVFLSFSSADSIIVRRLIHSFKSQNIDVWDYSRSGEEIDPGKVIKYALDSEIKASDYFFPLVSSNSTNQDIGRFTHYEVKKAIEYGMLTQGRIIPLLLESDPPQKEWPGEYRNLQEVLYLELDPEDNKKYQTTIVRICRYLNVEYRSPYLGDTRLPFEERFQNEIREKVVSNALYDDLMQIINEFSRYYAEKEWVEAYELINYFILFCKDKLPEKQLYYPRIIKGVCELHLGQFLEAEETFRESTRLPECDENAYGGLGQVYYRQDKYNMALTEFKKALRKCPVNLNKEIRFDILLIEIELGKRQINDSVLDEFNLDNLPDEEAVEILNTKGIVLYQRGFLLESLKTFEDAFKLGIANSTSVIYKFIILRKLGRFRDAIELLENETRVSDEALLYQYLADSYWEEGAKSCNENYKNKAINIYEEKLCKSPHIKRQFVIDLARLYFWMSNAEKVQECSRKVLDRKYFKLPSNNEDFFYDGFANYLLGDNVRAQYDYERSENCFEWYYDKYLR